MPRLPNQLFNPGFFGRLLEDFKLLFSLTRDYLKGHYRDVSPWSIVVFFLPLVYILVPTDLIPDFILGLGQLDDAAVLLFCISFLEKDLYKYKEWKMRSPRLKE